MRSWTEKDIENLIKDSAFPNPMQKDDLRARLFSTVMVLSPDDLDAAAGGTALPEREKRDAWPGPGEPGT